MLLGALINSALVVVGTLIGIVLKKNINQNMQQGIIKALGLVVVYLAISSMLEPCSTMVVLLSMAVGTLIGEWIDLDGKVNRFGQWLQKCFKGGCQFSVGFAQATLLFCVGSMGIIGSLESGLMNDHTTLIAKGIIDGIVSIFFAAENGIGVAFSAVMLLIYQGGISVFAGLLSPFINETSLSAINCVGGIILLSVGLNMLEISKFKSMNFVFAIVLAVILVMLGL